MRCGERQREGQKSRRRQKAEENQQSQSAHSIQPSTFSYSALFSTEEFNTHVTSLSFLSGEGHFFFFWWWWSWLVGLIWFQDKTSFCSSDCLWSLPPKCWDYTYTWEEMNNQEMSNLDLLLNSLFSPIPLVVFDSNSGLSYIMTLPNI